MDKVAIVTDSAASIPPEIAERLGIEVIPMQLIKDGEAFTVDHDITTREAYDAMRQGKVLKTTQPLVPHIQSAYEKALKRASRVLSVHISSKLTSTLTTCQMVADMMDPERIKVFDSQSLTIMCGLPCINAAKAAREGSDLDSALSVAKRTLSRMSGWLAVPTLKYLAQSGRVSKVLSTIGTLLSIKVILRIAEGEVMLEDRYRSSAYAFEKLVGNAMKECNGEAETLCFVHADNLTEAEKLSELILSAIKCEDVIFTDIGPTVGVHTGPGPIGVAVLPK